MHELTFTAKNYDIDFNLVTIDMPHAFFMDNIKHKLEHTQYCIQDVILKSPTGSVEQLHILGEHGSGIRYRNNKINLNVIWR